MRFLLLIPHLFPLLLAFLASTARASADGLRVVVSIPPLAGIIKPLLPRDATVTTLLAPGASEHGFELTPKDTAALAQADIVFYVGLDLEPQVQAVLDKHPSSTRHVVRFSQAAGIEPPAYAPDREHTPSPPDGPLPERPNPQDDHHEAAHPADHDDHDHAVDPHLWLDIGLIQKVVPALDAAILAASEDRHLSISRVEHDKARTDFLGRLQKLDDKLHARISALARKTIITHHNAFPRFAARYGLTIAAVIRKNENRDPTPGEIADVVKAVKDNHVHAIFVEPQFDPAVARRIAKAADAVVGTLDPLGTGDYFVMMEANLAALEANLRE